MEKIFDVHTHLQFEAFSREGKAIAEDTIRENIWMVNVGSQKDTSQAAVEFARNFKEGVWATVGLHPIHTGKSFHDKQEFGEGGKGFVSRGEEFDYTFYKNLAVLPQTVAIGECGLDYYHLEEDSKKKQQSALLMQIELARDVKKPLMIHCRNAFSDLIQILTSKKNLLSNLPGIIHFFTGSKEDAEKLLDLGFSFSFGGVITFTRDYDEVIKFIPLEKILLETDAPYVAPIPYRGKRNEPRYIRETAKKLAELKNISFEKTVKQTFTNALKIFHLPQINRDIKI